jgi:hypothetical protein
MPSLPTLSGAAALQQTLKSSELTATLPGAVDGGTNLSSAFAETLPNTSSERNLLREMEASVSSGAGKFAGLGSITGSMFGDATRSGQDTEKAAGASWFSGLPSLGSTDLGKKISEGATAMSTKFSGENNPFKKLAAGATSFFGLGGPKDAKKTGPGTLTDLQRSAQDAKATGQASAKQTNAAQDANADDKTYLVTLTDAEGFEVVFQILPEIVENRTVEYEAVAPPQFPGAFQKYKGTSSVQWSVNATLVCRTTNEATINLLYLNRLRGWTMPFFGDLMAQSDKFKDKIGAPPPVLTFHGLRTNIIGPVPVVITSLNWNWPRDVDYIPARKITDYGIDEKTGTDLSGFPKISEEATVPFPAVISIAIQLVESFSTSQFNGFDLAAYRVGDFENAYGMEMTYSNGAVDTAQKPAQQEAQLPSSPGGLTSSLPNVSSLSPLGSLPTLPKLPKIPPVPPALSEAKKFVSGGGGDFGGGGASGGW